MSKRLRLALLVISAQYAALLLAQDQPSTARPQRASHLPDLALQPPRVIFVEDFGPEHVKSSRGAQGVPGIERSPKGRLWAALLMVRNNAPDGKRSHMTAFVSDDDGATWKGGLLLDQRESSYPDGVQSPDGTIYIIYDHQRYTLNREGREGVDSVVMATFRANDVRFGRAVTDKVRLREVITQLRDSTSQSDGSEKRG